MDVDSGMKARSNIFRASEGIAGQDVRKIQNWYGRFILGMASFGLILPWIGGWGFPGRDLFGFERAIVDIAMILEGGSLVAGVIATRKVERKATDDLRAREIRNDSLTLDVVEVLYLIAYLTSRAAELKWLLRATSFAAIVLSMAGGPGAVVNLTILLLAMTIRLPSRRSMSRWAEARAGYLPLWPKPAGLEG